MPPTCFLAGTLVATEHGNIPIEEITKDMKVWSFCHKEKKWTLKKVTKVHAYQHNGEIIELQINQHSIKVTGEHPFWVQEGKALQSRKITSEKYSCDYINNSGYWICAKHLMDGDILLGRNKEEFSIQKINKANSKTTVYNLTVEDPGNYVVGEDEILVHNKILGM